jgi:Xaa-Pro dipeptidase
MISFREGNYDYDAALARIGDVDGEELAGRLACAEYCDFEATEYQRRHARLSKLMESDGIDAIIASQEENVRYFSGYLTILWASKFRPFLAILGKDHERSTLLVPSQERLNAEGTSWITNVVGYPAQTPPIAHVVEVLRRLDLEGARIGIELGFGQRLGMNQEQFAELTARLSGAEFVDATPLMQSVRMLKSPEEIGRIASACEISQAAVEAGWRSLRPGMSERELASVMVGKMYELGAEVGSKPSFVAIIAGERRGFANAVASKYVLAAGDFVFIDGGAVARGYVCDFIRHASLGRPSEEHARLFRAAIDANEAAVAAIRPGVLGCDVFEAADARIEELGFGEQKFMNIVGHGIGMDIHEVPWLGQRDTVFTADVELREGMVLCVEPGIVGNGDGAGPGHFILEDIVVVTDSGSRNLTSDLPKDVWVAAA